MASKLTNFIPNGKKEYSSSLLDFPAVITLRLSKILTKQISAFHLSMVNAFFSQNILIFLFILFSPIAPVSGIEITEFGSSNFNTGVISQRNFSIGILYPSNLLLLMLFISILITLAKHKKKLKIYSHEMLLAGFLIVSQLSVLWSINLSSSFVWFLKLILDLMVYFVFSRVKLEKESFKLILLAFFLNTMYEVLLSFLQFINGGLIGIPILESISRIDIERIYYYAFGSSVFRVVGTLSHPNMLSGYLTLLIPFLFAFIVMKPYKLNLIYPIIIPLVAATILMSFSRWGIITFLFSITISTVLFRRINNKLFARIGKELKFAFFFSIVTVLLFALNPFIFNRFFYFESNDASLATRVNLLNQASFVLQQNPLGIGGGASAAYLANFDVTSSQISNRYLPTVHEFYFLMATEVGIIGLILFLFFIISIIRGFYHNFKTLNFEQKIIGLAIVTSILVFLINGLWEPRPLGDRIGLFLFLIMGLLVNIPHQKKLPVSETS